MTPSPSGCSTPALKKQESYSGTTIYGSTEDLYKDPFANMSDTPTIPGSPVMKGLRRSTMPPKRVPLKRSHTMGANDSFGGYDVTEVKEDERKDEEGEPSSELEGIEGGRNLVSPVPDGRESPISPKLEAALSAGKNEMKRKLQKSSFLSSLDLDLALASGVSGDHVLRRLQSGDDLSSDNDDDTESDVDSVVMMSKKEREKRER